MYQNAAPAAATAASLPFTGLNIVWVLLAAFTLLAASGALWRIFPRKEA
jgi:hypothetical protein